MPSAKAQVPARLYAEEPIICAGCGYSSLRYGAFRKVSAWNAQDVWEPEVRICPQCVRWFTLSGKQHPALWSAEFRAKIKTQRERSAEEHRRVPLRDC